MIFQNKIIQEHHKTQRQHNLQLQSSSKQEQYFSPRINTIDDSSFSLYQLKNQDSLIKKKNSFPIIKKNLTQSYSKLKQQKSSRINPMCSSQMITIKPSNTKRNHFLEKIKIDSQQESHQITKKIQKCQSRALKNEQKQNIVLINSAIISSRINKIILTKLQSLPQLQLIPTKKTITSNNQPQMVNQSQSPLNNSLDINLHNINKHNKQTPTQRKQFETDHSFDIQNSKFDKQGYLKLQKKDSKTEKSKQNFIFINKLNVRSNPLASFELIDPFLNSSVNEGFSPSEKTQQQKQENDNNETLIKKIFIELTNKRLTKKLEEKKFIQEIQRKKTFKKRNTVVMYQPDSTLQFNPDNINELLNFSPFLREYINEFSEVCKNNQKFSELLNQYSFLNNDQFMFYLQKFIYYLCLLDRSQLQGLEFFKLNFIVMEQFSILFTESIQQNSNLSESQKSLFLQRFNEHKSKLQPNSLTEYFGSQQNIFKFVENLLQNLQNQKTLNKKESKISKSIFACDDQEDLKQKVTELVNYFLWGNAERVILLVKSYQKFTYDQITHTDFLEIKLCLVNTINQSLKLPPNITWEVIEKYEQYRNFIIFDNYISIILMDKLIKPRIVEKLKSTSKILLPQSLENVIDQLIDYIFNNISSKQFIDKLKQSTNRDRMIDIIFIQELKTIFIDTLRMDRSIPKIINFLIDFKFFKLLILLNLVPNYGKYLGIGELQSFLENYFKKLFQTQPLKFGYSMNDVYFFKGLFLIIDFYYCQYDIFSPFDLPLIINQYTSRKKYIFKLWFKGIKHCIMKKYHIEQPQAKTIRNQLKQVIFDNYHFELD